MRDEKLAYIIYTSGTTGVPKGVMIDHGGANTTIASVTDMLSLQSTDVLLMVSSLSFDLSVFDIFATLGVGAELVIPDHLQEHNPDHWLELISTRGVSVWNSAPQLMRMLVDRAELKNRTIPCLTRVMMSGDWIPNDLPNRVSSITNAGLQQWSLGGATEASIWSISHPIEPRDCSLSSIPYGRALPNQSVFVLDHSERCCPPGVVGRIHIGGRGLAVGYWQDNERSEEKFKVNRWSGERLYETGDLGRHREDGVIEILGRDDRQVKVRGHRIELSEIESVIRQQEGIKDTGVVLTARSQSGSGGKIVAFVTLGVELTGISEADKVVFSTILLQQLAQRLPSYMVPTSVSVLDVLPLSRNGKTHHAVLQQLAQELPDTEQTLIAPRTPIEQEVFEAWQAVMPDANICVTENFFDMGGDSVLATQLLGEIHARCDHPLEMHELFECLSIEALAELIGQARKQQQLEHKSDDRNTAVEWPDDDRESAAMQADLHSVASEIGTMDFQRPSADQGVVLITGATGWIGAHALHHALESSQSDVVCLCRSQSNSLYTAADLLSKMREFGLGVHSIWRDRIEVVTGDITKPRMGIAADHYSDLSVSVESIIHCAASLNVLASYSSIRTVNVLSALHIARFALDTRRKRVVVPSPMTHRRRVSKTGVCILTEASISQSAMGLGSGYAKSKWLAELVWSELAKYGLDVKLVRSSRALPSESARRFKTGDTYSALLQSAIKAEVVPSWSNSSFNGVPVNQLCRVLVELAQDKDECFYDSPNVLHVENSNPPSLQRVVEILLTTNAVSNDFPIVPFDDWLSKCSLAAQQLEENGSRSLVEMLTSRKRGISPVESMFTRAQFVENPYDGFALSVEKEYWLSLVQPLVHRNTPQNSKEGIHHDAITSLVH